MVLWGSRICHLQSSFANMFYLLLGQIHYGDVMTGAIASQITSLAIVYSTVYSDADEKQNIKAPRHWPLCGEFPGEFPAQMARNAENVSILWRHHVLILMSHSFMWMLFLIYSLNSMAV